nr:hypothetical protein [Mycoplasmopsis bovis]
MFLDLKTMILGNNSTYLLLAITKSLINLLYNFNKLLNLGSWLLAKLTASVFESSLRFKHRY